jgi:hypothetical protein
MRAEVVHCACISKKFHDEMYISLDFIETSNPFGEQHKRRCLTPFGTGRLDSGIPTIIPNLPARDEVEAVGQARCPEHPHS